MQSDSTSNLKITKEELYLNQVKLLDTFLSNGAITQAQYDKSFGDLTEKMGMAHLNPKSTNTDK